MVKRIEYIDALRGFTMILVVSVHVYSLCFMQGNAKEYDLSYNNFFGLFRMPLFFFISGFVFYKTDRIWNSSTLKQFLSNKIRVQIASTFVFMLFYCLIFQKNLIDSIYDNQKAGYWFTYVLFIYFIFYIFVDKTICKFTHKAAYNNLTIASTFALGLILFFFIKNGRLLNILSSQITTTLSISKWQYFLYFSFGCFIHKYYNFFIRFLDYRYVKGSLITIFAICSFYIFYNNNLIIPSHSNIIELISSVSGILLILSFFKYNEIHLSHSNKLGNCMQYIGKRTLDIYFLHYMFLPYNMSYIGAWLGTYPNPLLEFCMSVTLALIIISVCLIISNVIRLSPTLTYLLLGGKNIKNINNDDRR